MYNKTPSFSSSVCCTLCWEKKPPQTSVIWATCLDDYGLDYSFNQHCRYLLFFHLKFYISKRVRIIYIYTYSYLFVSFTYYNKFIITFNANPLQFFCFEFWIHNIKLANSFFLFLVNPYTNIHIYYTYIVVYKRIVWI